MKLWCYCIYFKDALSNQLHSSLFPGQILITLVDNSFDHCDQLLLTVNDFSYTFAVIQTSRLKRELILSVNMDFLWFSFLIFYCQCLFLSVFCVDKKKPLYLKVCRVAYATHLSYSTFVVYVKQYC